VTSYDIKVRANNWIGPGADTTPLTVAIGKLTSAEHSIVSGTGITTIQANVQVQVDVLAKDSDSIDRAVGGDIIFLEVTNECDRNLNFYCAEVASTRKVLDSPIVMQMTDNLDGTYSAAYSVPLDGTITVSVFLMRSGGAYSEWFDNLLMDGTPALSRIDSEIDFDWGTGPIIDTRASFVYSRFYTKIKAPYTEDYSFVVDGDSGFRFFFEKNLVIDRWDEC
jgi:hypothetical protein